MLVCNVSLARRRAGITAEVAEAASADDASTIGNIVFATLVDDPASVGEIVDAYLGEIMVEAASASTVLDANIPATYAVSITETTTAAETADGAVVVVPTTATWDPATVATVTLSGGNLVATNTGTTNEQGARVATTSQKTSGKYYYENTITNIAGGAAIPTLGIGPPTQTYTNMGFGHGVGGVILDYSGSGIIAANGTNLVVFGACPVGTIIGMAVDLDNRKMWFRNAPSGNWNASGTANPATNTGGITIPSGAMVPFWACSANTAGHVITAKFGASAFTGAVPSGFTSGWPA